MINNPFDTAKRLAHGAKLLGAALLVPFMTACLDYPDEMPDSDAVPVTFYLQTAAAQQTRAYEGELTAADAESAINDVKVWIYQGDNCVAYADHINADRKVVTSVPQSVLSNTVDVYIIANAASAGLRSLDASTSLATLTQSVIDASMFSAANPVTAVPEGGLPMSIIKKGCEFHMTDDISATLDQITLTRAVSKICFAFGKFNSDYGEIVGISLEKNLIAQKEYILPIAPDDATYGTASYTDPYHGDNRTHIDATAGYEDSELLLGSKTEGTLVASTAIHVPYINTDTPEDPANYTWDAWSASHSDLTAQEKATQYNTAIADFVTHTVYLRESDKKLRGTVYYRLSDNGDVKEASFEMDTQFDVPTDSQTQDFARNHVWIVYGYFSMQGDLSLVNVYIKNWGNGGSQSHEVYNW
mgnify:CR=1 FL=1